MRLRRLVSALTFLWVSAASAAGADKAPAFVGKFTDFNSADWRTRWGIVPDTLICNIAEGKAPCNWGYPNLKAVDDPTTPGGGQALEVTYPAPSGPPSCKCGIGGAQLYQDLKTTGQAALVQSPSVSLKYHYKFPTGFDFGGNTAGKLPGLYGGEQGCASGGQRCDGGWSTRYMWRGGGKAAPNGQIYWYSSTGSGYGADLGNGSWQFKADGQWHSIEQMINTSTGKIIVWHDGAMVFQTTQKFPGPVTGIFFSTFHGGHDTSWSPSKKTAAQFALFTVATDGPQTEASGGGGGSDAGVADAGSADAPGSGTGGNGAAPGTGGSSNQGSGGAGGVSAGGSGGSGSGGTPATATGGTPAGGGGSPAANTGGTASSPPSDSTPTSGGCQFGGSAPMGGMGVVAALMIALLVARRR